MEILHTDARAALTRLGDRRFDVVIGDAFHDIAVPYHLVTLEFARLVASRLEPGGLYALNLVDAFPDAKLVKALVKTLGGAFERVRVWLDRIPEAPTRVTYVISAGSRDTPEVIEARRGLRRRWLDVTEPLLGSGTPVAALPLLTDDRAPVERLLAELFLSPLGR
jgi:spermidine synthase